jgi:transcriptional regulator with XRE-family HTH domain
MTEFRRAAGYTQASLAKAVMQSPASIRDYEQGVANPSVRRLVAIADVLGQPVGAFFIGKGGVRTG